MKIAIAAVIALLAGFLLGGWAPRSELASRDALIQQLEAQLRERSRPTLPSLSGITRMLNVGRPTTPSPPQDDVKNDTQERPPTPLLEPTGNVVEAEAELLPDESFAEHLQQASEIWALRSDLARDAFLRQVGASAEQTVRFDVLIEAMNLRLESIMTSWAEQLAQERIPPNEAGVRLLRDITDALVITYDELDRSMPSTWRRDGGNQLQIADHIDPMVALPLAGIEDKLSFE